MDPAEYCREIESYLCRKNEGHLIRIVGPQFEQVCGWAQQGVPLKIAFRGIDQYCERYYAKGPRRRPVRIEYCEADILELFDGWRRAIGVSAGTGEGTTIEAPAARKPALAGHVERAIARLTASRAGARRSPDAKQARGDARARVIERLAALDVDLLAAASGEIDPQQAAALKREAEAELAPFKSRMPPEVRDRAIAAAYRRLVREALGLPVLEYE
jgi:hypothetical protein